VGRVFMKTSARTEYHWLDKKAYFQKNEFANMLFDDCRMGRG
jgi:hypothetical protein